MKYCSKCKENLSEDSFYKSNLSSTGLSSWCRPCTRKKQKNWRKKNPNHFDEWKEKNKELIKEYRAKSYQRNKEQEKKYFKKWEKENKEHRAEYNKKWREENTDRLAEYRHNRRVAEKNNPGNGVTAEQIRRLKEEQPSCRFCKTEENLSIDHIIPLVKNGAHDINNLQILCLHCNQSKGTKIL